MARLFVGTYSARGGGGLYPLTLGDQRWSAGQPLGGIENTSGGAYSPRFGLWYLVDETDEGRVTAYRPEGDRWSRLADQPTCGAEPCFAAVDGSGTSLAVANYGGGSVAVYALDPGSGLPAGPAQIHALCGSGPNSERQDAPHAHWVGFDPMGAGPYVVDLGADAISYLTRLETGLAGEVVFEAPAGSGPRLLAFHPKLPTAYLVSELASTLTILDRLADGRLKARRRISTLPEGFDGENLGGYLLLNAACDRLYVTNRGHDSIAVFGVDAEGDAWLIQHAPAGGVSPRFLHLMEGRLELAVANEESGSVSFLRVRPDGGLEAPHQTVEVPGAVFILEANDQGALSAGQAAEP